MAVEVVGLCSLCVLCFFGVVRLVDDACAVWCKVTFTVHIEVCALLVCEGQAIHEIAFQFSVAVYPVLKRARCGNFMKTSIYNVNQAFDFTLTAPYWYVLAW